MEKDTLIIENIKDISEILKGKTLDIIFELMSGELSEDNLISRLEMHPLKFKIYLNRLLRLNIIEKTRENFVKDKIEVFYKLKQKNLKLLIQSNDRYSSNLQIISDTKKYVDLLKNGFSSLMKQPEKPNKYFAVLIKTDKQRIELFKRKLNSLIDEFIEEDDESKNEIYMFLPMLFPYGLSNDKDNEIK